MTDAAQFRAFTGRPPPVPYFPVMGRPRTPGGWMSSCRGTRTATSVTGPLFRRSESKAPPMH